MAVLKVIEVLANSKKSWEDATQNAAKHAAKSLRNIGNITEYRVKVKISFEVE
jgi:flavin-binding protein dodecin